MPQTSNRPTTPGGTLRYRAWTQDEAANATATLAVGRPARCPIQTCGADLVLIEARTPTQYAQCPKCANTDRSSIWP